MQEHQEDISSASPTADIVDQFMGPTITWEAKRVGSFENLEIVIDLLKNLLNGKIVSVTKKILVMKYYRRTQTGFMI